MKTADEYAATWAPGVSLREFIAARDAEHAARLASARREAHEAGLREGMEAMRKEACAAVQRQKELWSLDHDEIFHANLVCDAINNHHRALSAPPAAPGEPVCQFVDKAGKVCGGTNGGEGRHDWHHPFQAALKEGTRG